MTAHPAPTTLERFFVGALPADENRAVVRHLISGCSDCQKTTSQLWETLVTGRKAPRHAVAEYDAVFDRAWNRATEFVEQSPRERELAQQRLAELLKLSPKQQSLVVKNDLRFQALAVCEAVLEETERKMFDDLSVAMSLATLAREIAELLDAHIYGAAAISDAKAQAWATYANAQRVSSDYFGAENSLRTAHAFLDAGTGDPIRKTRYLSALGVLLADRRRMDAALEVYRELERIYEELGDQHMVGRVQLKKAFVFGKMREPEREISYLQRGLELLDPARDPRRQTIALHNLVLALIDDGRAEEADLHMTRLEQLYEQQGGKLILIRFHWLKGRLAYAKGDLETAEQLYTEVRDAFIELEIGISLALVSLDLAQVLSDLGGHERTRKHLAEAIPILKALGFHDQALAAMSFLQSSVRQEAISAELIRRTAAFIRKVQTDPTARFRPSEIVEN